MFRPMPKMSKRKFVKLAAMVAREHTGYDISEAISIMTRNNRGAFNLWLGFLDNTDATEENKLIERIRKAMK